VRGDGTKRLLALAALTVTGCGGPSAEETAQEEWENT